MKSFSTPSPADALLFLWLALCLSAGLAHGETDFNREIRPILAGHCFACHGPDEEERKADLRLDQPSEENRRIMERDRGGASVLLERIFSADPDEVMPPPGSKHPLTETQKTLLQTWIDEGARYASHWAFEKPEATAPPELPRRPQGDDVNAAPSSGGLHPVDAFVRQKLATEGLTPSGRADRWSLARRFYLDLLGYAPTPEEASRYVNDEAPSADGRLIDRLLASPAYGERWARRWLDLARYADTNGYEKDRPRSIWPYRDWVIDALNADMPFDRFTVEQLAGDLLPEATLSQKVATGFHRNTMLNEEGGIDPQEFRFYSLVDRVNTTATVWLGLTLGCAQCHTHKFDPLEHRDYYAMMAYFNNAEEPELVLPDSEVARDRLKVEERVRAMEAALPEQFPEGLSYEKERRAWYENLAVLPWETLQPVSTDAHLSRIRPLDDGSLLAEGDQTKRDVYELVFQGDWSGVRALRLEALPHEGLPKSGPGRAYYEGPKGDFFLSEFEVHLESATVGLTGATESYGKLGIGGGAAGAGQAIDGNEVTGWSTSGGEGRAHQAVFPTEAPLEGQGKLTVRLIFNRHYPATLGRFRLAVTRSLEPARALPFSAADEDLWQKPWDQLSAEERERVNQLFCQVTPHLQEAREKIEEVRRSLPESSVTLVMRERPSDHPRSTFRHHRGEFLQPKEEVSAALPAILAPLTDRRPTDRLEFARWLVSSDNPLVARVEVNRTWSALFGRGLVTTPEDFGYQGASPTHPELLDWLAVDLVSGDWSRKRFLRSLMLSSVYQQSSRGGREARQKDPENRFLARGPRFRIEAEMIRDTALRSAGLLTSQIGGPSVFPPQPPNVTTEGTYGQLAWTTSEGGDRYRRGLYTFAKRTAPYAMFTTFDAGSGEACLAKREVTNTPLQALTALNDTVMLEAAQAHATHYDPATLPSGEQVNELFQRVLTRPPAEDETQWMLTFLEETEMHFRERPDDSQALAGEGAPPRRAAWVALARVLLNLDETYLHH